MVVELLMGCVLLLAITQRVGTSRRDYAGLVVGYSSCRLFANVATATCCGRGHGLRPWL